MRDIQPFVAPDEIRKYVYGLWKTDEFRSNHDGKGMVFDWVERFSRLPRLFADMSDDKLETPHFSLCRPLSGRSIVSPLLGWRPRRGDRLSA